MNQLGIVHPGLLAALTPNHYPSLCTIQDAQLGSNAAHEPTQTWGDLPGHVDLAARIAPVKAQEVRQANQIYVTATHHLALTGHYPSIREDMRAVVDGATYGIEGVEHDGQGATTRCWLRVVS